MDKRVQNFLTQQKNLKMENEKREREKLLISLGLYEKEYTISRFTETGMCEFERDPISGQERYFKKVAINISDEEFAQIKEAAEMSPVVKKEECTTAKMLANLAWISAVVGVIVGLALADESPWLLAVCAVTGITSGVWYFAAAKIITLLENIRDKK